MSGVQIANSIHNFKELTQFEIYTYNGSRLLGTIATKSFTIMTLLSSSNLSSVWLNRTEKRKLLIQEKKTLNLICFYQGFLIALSKLKISTFVLNLTFF
jgi:hypothetical protein